MSTPSLSFDTLKFVNHLEKAGVPRAQAVATSEAQMAAFKEAMGSGALAGKDDIQGIRLEIADFKTATKADIAGFKADIKAEIAAFKAETKAEIAGFRAETKAEIAGFRADTKAEIASFKTETKAEIDILRTDLGGKIDKLTWMFGALVLIAAGNFAKQFF